MCREDRRDTASQGRQYLVLVPFVIAPSQDILDFVTLAAGASDGCQRHELDVFR